MRHQPTLLFLAPAPPHPAGGGGALRMAQMLKYLARHYRVEAIAPRIVGSEAALAWAEACGFALTLIETQPEGWQRWLRLGPYSVDARLKQTIAARIGRSDIGAIVVQKPAMLPYLPKDCPVPALLDIWAYGLAGAWRALRHERGTITRLRNLLRLVRFALFDARWPHTHTLLLVSAVDVERARRQRPTRASLLVPNGVDCRAVHPGAERPNDAPPVLLFSGDMSFDPNIEAAERLATRIFPAIRAHFPASRLLLAGRNPHARVAALAGNGVEVTGALPEMLPVLQAADLYLAPLHTGAGTRTKLLEAFAAGLPAITTTTGIEGIEARNGVEVAIADSETAMIEAACSLLAERERRLAMGAAARRLVEQHYDWPACFAPLIDRLAPLLRAREEQ